MTATVSGLFGVFGVSGAAAATGVNFADPRVAAITLVTFAVLAVVVSASGALVYRWYFRSPIPEGVAVLLGVSIVALYLNTTSLGALVSAETAELLTVETVVFNVAALALAAVVAPAGRYAGDRLAVDVFALSGMKGIEGEMSRFVRSVGRMTPVTLPAADEIEDMDTYEPVTAEKKAEMAERTLIFARGLTVEQLRERLVERVKTDYGVGYVDVDVDQDGALEYFAVGSRVTGIGPTLAPGRVAVALSADPPNNATAGDMVQIWRTEPEAERVATGELRGVAGDAATVALDESDAETLSPEGGYRLVTLPAEPQADREFASLLRNADETMATVTVEDGGELVGTTVGEVSAVVAAVRPVEGSVQPIPRRAYVFAAGDTAFLVGRPDAIRRFEAEAKRVEGESDGEGGDGGGPDSTADAGDAVDAESGSTGGDVTQR
ncbi:cation:proton antiporter regulatory subunit [Halorubrum rubrum]|uniref:Cation:proton antiporter regulatory subunit n=1 Tax=Halorubrum rubrum TaxID=1126240 RepID=A0ABD5R261_9EURY|nr:TrkA C-terminal domain-containing protein [Halorubrum rubrum]